MYVDLFAERIISNSYITSTRDVSGLLRLTTPTASMVYPWSESIPSDISEWGLTVNSPGLTTYQRPKPRQLVCWFYSEDLCKNVANRLRHKLTLPCPPPSWNMCACMNSLPEGCPGWSGKGAKTCRQMDMREVGQSESLLVQNIWGMPVPAKLAHCAAKTPAALMLSNL